MVMTTFKAHRLSQLHRHTDTQADGRVYARTHTNMHIHIHRVRYIHAQYAQYGHTQARTHTHLNQQRAKLLFAHTMICPRVVIILEDELYDSALLFLASQ